MANYDEIRSKAYPNDIITDVFSLTCTVIGMTLSSSVLYIIFTTKWKRLNIDLKLISTTLVFDILTGLVCILNCGSNITNLSSFLSVPFWCNIDACLNLLTFVTSINLVGVVSLERCLLVVYNKKYHDMFYWGILGSLFTLNLGTWVLACLRNGYWLVPTTVYCLFNLRAPAGKVSNILIMVSLCISMTMIYVGYLLIVFKKKTEERMIYEDYQIDISRIKKNPDSTIAKSLIIILVSTLTNLPYCVLLIITIVDPAFHTPLIDCIGACCIILNQVLNTVLVLHMRPDLYQSLKSKLLSKNKDLIEIHQLDSTSSITHPRRYEIKD